MKYVITDLNSPWCVYPTDESATEEHAKEVHLRQQDRDQHGYVPDELAEALQRAWDQLMAVDTAVDAYRATTGQGESE